MESFDLALVDFKKAENSLKRAQEVYDKSIEPAEVTRARKALNSAEMIADEAYERLERHRQDYWMSRYSKVKSELFEKAAPLIAEAVQCCKNTHSPGLLPFANRLEVIKELLHNTPPHVELECEIPDVPFRSDVLGRI
ncbi:MAG: hypothetical protein AB7U63_09160 [Porticoccaceae bacterium]